jgi:hypothetical protein
MEQIKAFIFRDKNDGELTVIMQDGGVASTYNPDDYYRTDYYQSRMTPETTLDTVWEELGEGKMYTKDWDGNDTLLIDELNEEKSEILIDDMIRWLFLSTREVEVVKIEMGELSDETFQRAKQQLNFNEE